MSRKQCTCAILPGSIVNTLYQGLVSHYACIFSLALRLFALFENPVGIMLYMVLSRYHWFWFECCVVKKLLGSLVILKLNANVENTNV